MALGDPYVSVAELKTELDVDDSDDDLELDVAVDAASAWVTSWCGRDFNQAATATARIFYVPYGSPVAEIDDISTVTGLIVATGTGDGTFATTWVTTDYQLEPLNGVNAHGLSGWPYTAIRSMGGHFTPYRSDMNGPSLQVTARWGWPAVPAPVKKATLIMAARLYKRRDSAEGVLGGFGDFGPIRVGTRLDPDVEMLLDPYRLNPVVVA
jgi:hypothetical protein